MINLLFTNDIALSMFMFSLFVVVVCGHFKWKWICAGFFHGFFISILSLEIQLSKGSCTIINRFNLVIYVCLSLARKWISKCHRWLGRFAFEMIGGCSLCWYWWNCWPSLFKKSLKILKGKSESIFWRRTDSTIAKRKKDKQRSTKHYTENFLFIPEFGDVIVIVW